jgi:hypothetical protein
MEHIERIEALLYHESGLLPRVRVSVEHPTILDAVFHVDTAGNKINHAGVVHFLALVANAQSETVAGVAITINKHFDN